MTRIAILGATGYTALELMKILLRHPGAEIVAVTSRQEGQPHVAMIHPSLTGRVDLRLEDLSPAEVAARAECVFSCLPHGASAAVIPAVLSAGCRVVDFSADYRLGDPETYATWYGQKHADPGRVGKVVYGLPELFREKIPPSSLVANPGCYPTSAILALAPLLKARLVDPTTIIVDSKSGVSGAGRTPKLTTHYPECNESISAYNVGRHRHTPEI
jgi:N-acetyl-gamma-glutamyl-phosphate reductase